MRKVNIGVVGAGWWAVKNHIPLLTEHEKVNLVAVCRLGKEELSAIAKKFAIGFSTENYDEMLSIPDLDGVVVASPHNLHSEQAIKALKKNLHVLVEKPMATNLNDARKLYDVANKTEKELLIPLGWNFQNYVEKAREYIQQNKIGLIKHVSMQMASPAEELFSGLEYSGAESDMFKPDASTWASPDNYGGYGWGQFSHILGCLFWIAEDLRPEEVYCISQSSASGVDMFDALTIRFNGGRTGILSGAGSVPMNSGFQVDIRLFGTEGMLLLDFERERLVIRRHDNKNEEYYIEEGAGDYVCDEPINRFVEICSGKNVINPAPVLVGLRAVEVIENMYHSIKLNTPVAFQSSI